MNPGDNWAYSLLRPRCGSHVMAWSILGWPDDPWSWSWKSCHDIEPLIPRFRCGYLGNSASLCPLLGWLKNVTLSRVLGDTPTFGAWWSHRFMAVVLRTVPLQPWRCGISLDIGSQEGGGFIFELAILLVTFLEWWKRYNFEGVVGIVQKGSKGCAVKNEDETKFNFPSLFLDGSRVPPPPEVEQLAPEYIGGCCSTLGTN